MSFWIEVVDDRLREKYNVHIHMQRVDIRTLQRILKKTIKFSKSPAMMIPDYTEGQIKLMESLALHLERQTIKEKG